MCANFINFPVGKNGNEVFDRKKEDQMQAIRTLLFSNVETENNRPTDEDLLKILTDQLTWDFENEKLDNEAPLLFIRCPECEEIIAVIVVTYG